jgi:hypothetical protein
LCRTQVPQHQPWRVVVSKDGLIWYVAGFTGIRSLEILAGASIACGTGFVEHSALSNVTGWFYF